MSFARHLSILVFFILSVRVALSQGTAVELYGPYLGQEPPGEEPRIFVPEHLRSNSDWWWHGAPAFSPDGSEFYLDIYLANQGIRVRVMEMDASGSLWSAPRDADFVGSFDTSYPSSLSPVAQNVTCG